MAASVVLRLLLHGVAAGASGLLACMVPSDGLAAQSASFPSRLDGYLRNLVSLTPHDERALQAGRPVTKLLEGDPATDVAVFGAIWVAAAPELYIAQTPFVNAGAIGVDRPFVVLQSGTLGLLDLDELQFVIGHELGHVLSGHALYKTMLHILLRLYRVAASVPLGGAALFAVIAGISLTTRNASPAISTGFPEPSSTFAASAGWYETS